MKAALVRFVDALHVASSLVTTEGNRRKGRRSQRKAKEEFIDGCPSEFPSVTSCLFSANSVQILPEPDETASAKLTESYKKVAGGNPIRRPLCCLGFPPQEIIR